MLVRVALGAATVVVGFLGGVQLHRVVVASDAPRATVAVDFVIAFLKANGTHADKVFKLTTGTLEPGASLRVAKRHPIRPITTRVYYPGDHFVDLQVNGVRAGRVPFRLAL